MSGATFHAGERALQARAGSQEQLAVMGPRIVRDHMPEQHRELFTKLPSVLLGALDAAGRPWATMLAGAPGFIRSPDAQHLHIVQAIDGEDPVLVALQPGAPFGLLGLEPHTRRRNRMNGVVEARDAQGLGLAVRQSFGNCPKYIQARRPEPREGLAAPRPAPRTLGPALDAQARALVARSDTVFIASASARPERLQEGEGVDVSHRGGPSGFVVQEAGADGGLWLTLPDYPGNRFFNTLGNLSQNPAAGLLFVDYDSGGLLQLSADAKLLWDGRIEQAAGGVPVERRLRLRVRGGVWREGVLPWRWTAPEPAPQFLAPP